MPQRFVSLLVSVLLIAAVVLILWLGRAPGEPPVLEWRSPAAEETVEAGRVLTLEVSVLDADSLVERVEFRAGDALLGTVREPPYVWSWEEVPVGEWTLGARAVDETGLAAEAPPRRVSASEPPNAPPVVKLGSPADGGAVRAGRPLEIRAWASDTDGRVRRVEFLVDGRVAGTSEALPWEVTVPGLEEGPHRIAVRAVDDAGGTATSPEAVVTAVRERVMNVAHEAEAGEVRFPMIVAEDENASGGRFVTTLIRERGGVAFDIDLKVPATVACWCRVLARDGMHDSFYVTVNGETDIFDILEKKWTGEWEWVPLCGRGGTGEPEAEKPRLLRLPAGRTRIVFRGRERNTFLDRIILTDELDWYPEGAKWDAYGNRVGVEAAPGVF